MKPEHRTFIEDGEIVTQYGDGYGSHHLPKDEALDAFETVAKGFDSVGKYETGAAIRIIMQEIEELL